MVSMQKLSAPGLGPPEAPSTGGGLSSVELAFLWSCGRGPCHTRALCAHHDQGIARLEGGRGMAWGGLGCVGSFRPPQAQSQGDSTPDPIDPSSVPIPVVAPGLLGLGGCPPGGFGGRAAGRRAPPGGHTGQGVSGSRGEARAQASPRLRVPGRISVGRYEAELPHPAGHGDQSLQRGRFFNKRAQKTDGPQDSHFWLPN